MADARTGDLTYLEGYEHGREDECRTWARLGLFHLLWEWWSARQCYRKDDR